MVVEDAEQTNSCSSTKWKKVRIWRREDGENEAYIGKIDDVEENEVLIYQEEGENQVMKD